MSDKILYGRIVITAKASQVDINKREMTLSDALMDTANDLENWLKTRAAAILFDFEVECE